MAGQYSQAQLDALAREQGFKNYAQWSAWNQRTRNVVLQQPNVAGGGMQAGGAPKNWLQTLLESIPGHPAHALQYVNRQMGKVMGGE